MTTKNKITDVRREVFYAELHALLTAGLDFSHAFALLIEGERDARMKGLLKGLYDGVVGGSALWQAMERSGAFRPLDCGVVRIGEQTGRLSETLEFLGGYYRKRTVQRRMVSSAVSYPLVILCTAVAVVAFMLAVIVPMFEQVYARMGGELPALTRWIISLSKSFPAYAAAIAVAGSAAYIILYTNRNRKEVQRWTSELMLRLPVAGAIIRKNHQAQFCKLLYLLCTSGVPLLTGVGMLSDVIGFYPYRQSFASICRGLEHGELFSACVARFPALYDRKLTALVRVGEETNRLAEMLRRQGDALTDELEYGIRRMGSLLEPALIMLVGLLVAVILISMYMPMFRLGGIMGT
ncbi:type II secretion system F family protein [uncultured Alistipes sp.]|uniref:type II secretion system F family protein n=2 Tax=Alistipes TaxID=239759 RepID=UPI002582E025|nr:type II secretion system F family protein [uncultured Alistipes sp.]